MYMLLSWCAAILGLMAAGVAAQSQPVTQGPLAGLPSQAGPHIQKIKALGDNAWLDLGAPAADPKWGKARGRSWSCAMPLAVELRGAFLFGEGVHGFVKPDGHFMDDLWFYDLNAHRWICCYPGLDGKKLPFRVSGDGLTTTPEGRPLPIASQGHGYQMVTYEPGQRKFLSMPCPAGYYTAFNKKWKELVKDRPAPRPQGLSPWAFDVDTGQWERRVTSTKSPPSSFGDVLLYVPTRKQIFFWHGQEVWFYDPAKNAWSRAAAKGPRPPFGIDPTACYDARRDRIYMGGGSYPVAPAGSNALWVYDLKTDTWLNPQSKGSAGGSTSYATNNAMMTYDSANDVVLLFRHKGDKGALGVFVYDPQANAWSDGPVAPLKATGQCQSGFFDPELNVQFIFGAGDSNDNGTVWIYRYKGPKKK
jgi:hypothetical protein